MDDLGLLLRVWPIPASVFLLSFFGPKVLKGAGKAYFAASVIGAWLLSVAAMLFIF
jgi:hypothetical protein